MPRAADSIAETRGNVSFEMHKPVNQTGGSMCMWLLAHSRARGARALDAVRD
jgi:hypothetical protein